MDYPEDDSTNELIDTFSVGCYSPFSMNDLGLCDTCFAKLELDLIRSRDWAYSITTFGVAPGHPGLWRCLRADWIPKKPKTKAIML